ncbi:MAG: hypothetical protein C4547_16805 [Phycisphaerales bacterium]|nr:MAG: hypothetical protein C4547_16805 [Phycisphaerales bacterium]
MIQKLRLDGYRLLDGFEADFGRLTVVIGANAAGKSSLLESLSLISNGVDWPVSDVVGVLGGMWSIPNAARACDEIGWQLTFEKPSDHGLWSRIPIPDDAPCTYEARLGRDPQGRVIPRYECLRYARPRAGHSEPFKMLEVDRHRARIFSPKTGKLTPFDEPSESSSDGSALSPGATPIAESQAQKASLTLAHMRFENEFPVPTWIRAYFASFSYYPGFDVSRGSPVRNKPAEFRTHIVLSASGDNLGTVLHELLTRHEYRDRAAELTDFLKAAYPQIEHLSAETAFGGEPRVLVRVRERGLQRPTELWEMSDGMLHFLLLAVALLSPTATGLITVDEPEAGLHPKLLPIVADMIRSASSRTQVLVTTHSPSLLDAFELDNVAVMSREGAAVSWHRPGSRETLRRMLDSQLGGTLGELHASGELEAMA